MRLKTVGIVGGGVIGTDFAYGFASKLARQGTQFVVVDVVSAALEAAKTKLEKYIGKAIDKGKLDEAGAEKIRAAITWTSDYAALAECDVVFEATSERLDIKQRVLRQIERVVRPDCLIGCTSSGIPRVWLTAGLKHPNRVFITHPFTPAWKSLPVELVSSGNPDLTKRVYEVLVALGKVPIFVKDRPCFAADYLFARPTRRKRVGSKRTGWPRAGRSIRSSTRRSAAEGRSLSTTSPRVRRSPSAS